MNQNIKESDVSEENAKYLYLKYKGKYFRLKNKLKGNGPTPSTTPNPPKSTSMFKSMSGISSSLFKKTPPPAPTPVVNLGLDGKMKNLISKINSNVSAADVEFKQTITNLTNYFNAMKNIEGYNEAIDEAFVKYFRNLEELKEVPGNFKDQTPDEIRATQEIIKKNLEIKDKLKQRIEVIQKLNEECKNFKTILNDEDIKIKSGNLISFKKNIVLDCLSPPDEKNSVASSKKLEEEKRKNIIR
jgi:hypothetical protein